MPEDKKPTLTIDEISYPLRLDFNAIAAAERESGCNLLTALMDLRALDTAQLRGLLTACMRAGNPAKRITVSEVGQLLRFDTILPVTLAIGDAIIASLPKTEEPPAPAEGVWFMGRTAGVISIELRASIEKMREDLRSAAGSLTALGASGSTAGRQIAGGMSDANAAVQKTAKSTSEGAAAVATSYAAIIAAIGKYTAVAAAGGSATEGLANSYRALRIALSPTPLTVATVAAGLLTEATIKLTLARGKLIEQESLLAAISRQPISTIQQLGSIASITGGNAGALRSLSSTLSSRVDSNQSSVRSGLNTLGISSSLGRQGEALDPELLEKIARGFDSIEDPAKRAAAAVQIFGADHAAEALGQLSLKFIDGAEAVRKYGMVLDSVSRTQIFQFRQDMLRIKEAVTDFSALGVWWANFKTGAEIVAAAAEDMAKRGAKSFDDLIARTTHLRGIFADLQTPVLNPSGFGLSQGQQQGILADDFFAQAQGTAARAAATLEGRKAAQAAAQSRADSAYSTLQADAQKRQINPQDSTLLTNEQRFNTAVQQQSAAALAASIGLQVAAMEDAAQSQKEAEARAAELAAFRAKEPERLKALIDAAGARSLKTPIAQEMFRGSNEVTRDADKTSSSEKQARAFVATVELQQVVGEAQKKWFESFVKEAADAKSRVDKLFTESIKAKETDERIVALGREVEGMLRREDADAIAGQHDTAEHQTRMAGIQSLPGDEAALAKSVLDIRLQTVIAERAVIAAHADLYDMDLETSRLDRQQQDAWRVFYETIGARQKELQQAGLGAGGNFQQRLIELQQQLAAVDAIQVTDKNILAIDLARKALADQILQVQVDQLLALGSLKDGWGAFWISMQEQAEKPGKILYDGMHSALDKVSSDLGKLITDPKHANPQKLFSDTFKSVGNEMVTASVKSTLQTGLGSIGKLMHIPGLSTAHKPTGAAGDPIHTVDDSGKGKGTGGAPGAAKDTLGALGKLGPIFSGSQGGPVFNFSGGQSQQGGGDFGSLGSLAGLASLFSGGGTRGGNGMIRGPSGFAGDPVFVALQAGSGGGFNLGSFGSGGSGGTSNGGGFGGGNISISGTPSTGSIPSSTGTPPIIGLPPITNPRGGGDKGGGSNTGNTSATTAPPPAPPIGIAGLPTIIFGRRTGGQGGGRGPVDGDGGGIAGAPPIPGSGRTGDISISRNPDGTINRTGSVIGGVPPLGGINEGDPSEATGYPPGSPDTSDTGGDTGVPQGSVDSSVVYAGSDTVDTGGTILDPPGSGNNPDPTGESGSDEENLVEPSTLAYGGPVFPNKPAIVGEGGEPEYYHPDSAGTVIPFRRLAALMRGGSFHGLKFGGARAMGGDVTPDSGYVVGDGGEPEIFKPHTAGRVTPLSKMGGDNYVINNHVDARGAELGAANRLQRTLEQTHRASVSSAVQASEERARRTVQVR